MRVLGPIVHQQQDLRVRDRLREEIEERLRLIVDPVQILEDHNQRWLILSRSRMRLIASSVRRRFTGPSICDKGSSPSTMPNRLNRYGSVSSKLPLSATTRPVTFSRRLRSSSVAEMSK